MEVLYFVGFSKKRKKRIARKEHTGQADFMSKFAFVAFVAKPIVFQLFNFGHDSCVQVATKLWLENLYLQL